MRRTLIFLPVLAIVFTGCWSTLTRIPQVDAPTFESTLGYAEFLTAPDFLEKYQEDLVDVRYKVQPGSVLRISITGAPEMSRTVLVSPDGFIDYPHIKDEIRIGQRTVPEIREIMRDELKDFFVEPEIRVNFVEGEYLRSMYGYVNVVNVSGGRGRPVLRGGEKIMDIIASLGAITPASAWQTVAVYRTREDNKPLIIICNIRDILIHGDFRNNIPIQSGDIVYVPTEENDWLQEFYASLQMGNALMSGTINWRNNMMNLMGRRPEIRTTPWLWGN